jgi:hypothetical protein
MLQAFNSLALRHLEPEIRDSPFSWEFHFGFRFGSETPPIEGTPPAYDQPTNGECFCPAAYELRHQCVSLLIDAGKEVL